MNPPKEWIEDLDRRCEEHLKAHPEDSEQRLLPAVAGEIPYLAMRNKIVASVEESPYVPGNWRVLLNGEVMRTFVGPTAHQQATQYVNDLLKD